MREPAFWRERDPRSRASAPVVRLLLTPIASLYSFAGARRIAMAEAVKVEAKVICVGNVTLGGAGKTPVAAAIRSMLASRGARAATLSRGYGGRLAGPLRVNPALHLAADVGDEPLMLAGAGESWIARERPIGAAAMTRDGVEVIVMDDGHQNPDLHKDVSIVVMDAGDPFGNGFVFPKGPLREPVSKGLARADIVLLMGDGDAPAAVAAAGKPVVRGRLEVAEPPPPGRYVAFAGIGRPARFFAFLSALPGIELAEAAPFADHHAYRASDLKFLERLATEHDAKLITTEKDHVRLPFDFRAQVTFAPVEARLVDGADLLTSLLDGLISPTSNGPTADRNASKR